MASFALNVLLKYESERLAAYGELDSPDDTLKRLRHHLTELKIPHPKPENVRFVAGEGVHFCWITKEGSALYNQVSRGVSVHGQGSPVMRRYFIESLEMKRQPVPSAPSSTETFQPAVLNTVLPSIGVSGPHAPLLLPSAVRRDSLSNLTPEEAKMQVEAQQFLDGLGLGPASAAMMDVDQPILHPALSSTESHRASSVASSIGSSRNEYPMLKAARAVGALMEDESCTDIPDYLISSDSRASTPRSDHDEMIMSPSPAPGLQTLPTRDIKIFEDDEEHFHVQPAAEENARPVVVQLCLELQEIHREVAAHLMKEQAILQALKNLDAKSAELVDPSPSTDNDDFVARVRLQMLQNELETVLVKRQAAEASVRGIARERRAPFVFPALMDAFVGISRLSTYVLGSE
ncbi:hypothetical protein C8F04DRAFT_1081235 [Mycena alexandri]|uniref:Uncharacterized protein n=1 Tax=Mycena alexandri TaxID=1745969 RepID=A0AAD6T8S1_9AGAR|nr:hypothetical protein C8F04DRAFT_1081235 [Mycena alexandri]